MISEIEKYKSAFDLNTSIQGFDQKFDKIKNTVSKFNDKVTESIDQNNFWEFPQLFDEGIKLKRQIDSGAMFRQFAIFKVNREIMGRIYSLGQDLPNKDDDFVHALDDFKQKLK